MKLAIIKTGGKQYIATEGSSFRVEKLEGNAGDKISFAEVLLVSEDDKSTLGTPTVAGKTVEAEIVEQGRADKVIVMKYMAKSRYKKKNGHRQPYTKVKITSIK
ncbi:MAG: 50S ribosomal protein L21 [Candidatus Paceibacterota bacterium]|jgi:large subunit ribosomal protein L21